MGGVTSSDDSAAFFDAMHAFGPPSDPLDGPELLAHVGVTHLRTARELLAANDPAAAADAADRARRVGLPAEIVPHGAAILGTALALDGRREEAAELLIDCWREHPDVAALPALLGSVRLGAGDATSAAHAMHAALVTDDPDRSLAVHRALLMQLFRAAQRGAR